MKVDLSRKEYRDLLDMLYIAEWIIHARREKESPRTKRYSKLEQKFYALAKKMKYENLIEYDPEDKTFYPTREFEETSNAHTFIDEFEEARF